MTSEPGLLYGLAFFATLCVAMFVISYVRNRAARTTWERAHPIIPGSGATLLARLAEQARPTLLLIPAESPSFSKLGGQPELPPAVDWPNSDQGPRAFLGQVDLAALQAGGDWLPADGWLYAFCDPERSGWADQVKVIFSRDAPGPEQASSMRAYRERRVAFRPYVSFPSSEWLDFDERIDMGFEEFEAQLDKLGERPPGEDLLHRIGGYPDEIQNGCLRLECEHLARGLPPYVAGVPASPEVEHASWEWRLLLQIDSDDELGMNFGDGGRLYVFIRESDARVADFSRTVTLSQCY